MKEKGDKTYEFNNKKIGKFSVNIVTSDEKTIPNEIVNENDIEMDNRAKEAVRSALSKAEFCKKLIARYDVISKKAYVEFADGEKSMSTRKPMVLLLAGPNGYERLLDMNIALW